MKATRKKRLLGLLMSLCLVISCVPADVFAADGLHTSSEACLQAAPDAGLPENEELFSYFVERELYDYHAATYGTAARKRLNAAEKGMYDALKVKIEAVAANGGSTVFTFSDISGLTTSWSNEDLGVTGLDEAAVEAAFLSQFSLTAVIDALMTDCPFDLYWYDKIYGVNMSYGIGMSGNGGIYTSATITEIEFAFSVCQAYSAGDYTVTSDVAKIATAKANAAQVVATNASKTDREKLTAYRNYICAQVTYDFDAATNITTPYGDPWQLISVFDGDDSTNVVCEGYSKAFQYLCDLSTFTGDTTCYTVTGTMGGAHMWNIVTLEDVNYLVDVTNCDRDSYVPLSILFLVNGTGSIAGGYTVAGFPYTYDPRVISLWGSGTDSILNISATGSDELPEVGEITWRFDEATGTLTISGTGPMANYRDENAPWRDLRSAVKSVVIEEGITSIGMDAFYGFENMTDVTVPSTVVSVGGWAFAGCSKLTNIHISDLKAWLSIPWNLPNNLMAKNELDKQIYVNGELLTDLVVPTGITAIGDQVFWYCADLESVVIPEGVVSIGVNAFADCPKLKEITLPASLTYSDNSVFAGSDNIERVYISDLGAWMRATFVDDSSNPLHRDADLYLNGELLTDVVVPEDITTISSFLFFHCTSIESITLHSGVTEIGAGALSYCPKLKEINLPVGLKTIGEFAFEGSSLESVTVPSGVTSVGKGAFLACPELVSVSLPDTVTELGVYVFDGCEKLASVRLPSGTKTLGLCMFRLCSSLESITIPEGVTSIGEQAFLGCRSLTSITLPDNVTEIGGGAFDQCAALTSITIPKNVTSIGDYVFTDCNALRKIYFEGDAPAFADKAFGDRYFYPLTATVYYPVGNDTWTEDVLQNYGGDITWVKWNPAGNRVYLTAEELGVATTVCIDGVDYPVLEENGKKYVDIPGLEASVMTVYTYNDPNAADIHTQYPTGMKVWRLHYQDGAYVPEYIPEFDNLLQYSGSSIRIVGNKGIRMITSVSKPTRTALQSFEGIKGYHLQEYGTALAWASEVEADKGLTLGQSYTKSNYAYLAGVKDPIYKQTKDLIQYTNVLVGFTNDQCKDDIAMRPYMVLIAKNGDKITVYGGVIYRSIGYIAYQNRNAFAPGTNAYDYVWSIIHHVYDDKFDTDFKG